MNEADRTAVPRADEEVWASYCEGENGAMDYYIIGSRAGLQRLKQHIEIAIEKGESPMHGEPGMDFAGVRREDRRDNDEARTGWVEKFLTAGCLALIIAVLVLAIFGLAALLKS